MKHDDEEEITTSPPRLEIPISGGSLFLGTIIYESRAQSSACFVRSSRKRETDKESWISAQNFTRVFKGPREAIKSTLIARDNGSWIMRGLEPA